VYRALIFDLFHTLTARESQWSEHPPSSDALGIDRAAWNQALFDHSRWRLCGEERDPVTIVRRLAHSIDPAIPLARIEAATRARIERFRHALQSIPPENIDTLKRLRGAGYRLALLSNADVMEVGSWGESPLSGLFDIEVFSCYTGLVKPEPAIFQLCLERLGLAAHVCLFVGDGGSSELVAARAAGITTVFMSGVIEELWPETIPERLNVADYHVRNISELLSLTCLSTTAV
jgi:putative hydrolase of the HAD superfamily